MCGVAWGVCGVAWGRGERQAVLWAAASTAIEHTKPRPTRPPDGPRRMYAFGGKNNAEEWAFMKATVPDGGSQGLAYYIMLFYSSFLLLVGATGLGRAG